MPVCSKQPRTPDIPLFCTDVSMYLLLNRKLESLLATDAKEDFTLQAEQGDNQKLVYIL